MSSEFDGHNLVDIFVSEASDGMAVLNKALHPDDGDTVPSPAQLHEQYIVAHRIRGAAALYGYQGIAKMSERLEWLLEQAGTIREADWPQAVGAMREIVQGIQSQVTLIRQGQVEDLTVVERLSHRPMDGLRKPPEPHSSPAAVRHTPQDYLVPMLDAEVLSYFAPEAEEYLDTIDGLVRILETNPTDEDASYRLFRTAHTLKGSSYTVGFQVIGDVAHPMEECMVAVREGRAVVTGGLLRVMTQAVALIRLLLRRSPAHVSRFQSEIPSTLHLLKEVSQGQSVVLPTAPQAATHTSVEAPASPAPVADTNESPKLSDGFGAPFGPGSAVVFRARGTGIS